MASTLYRLNQGTGFGFLNLLTKVWWAELGRPHPQVKVHSNPGQELPENGNENHFKHELMLLFMRRQRRPTFFANVVVFAVILR